MSKHLVGVIDSDRRATPRFSTTLTVVFIIDDEVVQATADDVSMTGMRLSSEVDLDIGTRLDAHFSMKGGLATHKLKGRIVWSRPSDEIAGLWVAGFEFSTLPQATSEQLALLIQQLGGELGGGDLPMLDDSAVTGVQPEEMPELDTGEFSPLAEPFGTGDKTASPSLPKPGLDGGVNEWTVSKHLDQGIADTVEAQRENPHLANAVITEARAAQANGDIKQAVVYMRRAAELMPDSDQIVEELATVVYLSGDTIEAARLFDRALRLRMHDRG